MKKAVLAITFFDMLFLVILSVAGMIGGTVGGALYYFAFLIPLCFAFAYVKSTRNDDIKPQLVKLLPDKKSISYTLPIIAPFIAAVFLISFVTSWLLGLLGYSDTTDVSGNLFLVILKHALLPAFFEEALFRLVPIMLLFPYSKKNAVIVSSVFFACIHCNLFQIPYALAAGIVLAFVTVSTESIVPAFILHFLNNLASIVFMRNGGNTQFSVIFFISLLILVLVSLVFIFVKRNSYLSIFNELKTDKCNLEFGASGVLLVAMTLIVGAFNLWMTV